MPDLSKLSNLATALRDRAETTKNRQKTRRWFDIKNARSDVASVYLYDMIGDDGWGGGISARDFTDELRTVTASTIDLHISSEGGEVFDGIAIYEALKQHPARVEVSIDSLAASAASFVAMAGDTIRMARNAKMMIHDAAMGGAYAAGNAADMRKFAQDVVEMADLLDDMSNNIADIYAQRAGGDVTEWRKRMSAETWFSAQQAKDAGLVDEILGETTQTSAPPAEETPVDAVDVAALHALLMEALNA